MTLGLTSSSSGGDFLPLAIYDARAGRLFKIERSQGPDGWMKERIDITSPPPTFAFDMGSIEVGWIWFSLGAPDFHMVPFGADLPPQPSKDHKKGFRAKIAGKVLDGVREFSQTAQCVLAGIDELHEAFIAAPEAAAGKIPIVRLSGTLPIMTRGGGQTSTNYKPIFDIVGWTDRLPEMGNRTVPPPLPMPSNFAQRPVAPQQPQQPPQQVEPPWDTTPATPPRAAAARAQAIGAKLAPAPKAAATAAPPPPGMPVDW